MTREEALKILKYRSGWNLSIRDVNALEMAIEALEQEPCGDIISRQAAIATAVRAAIDWHRLANPQYSIAYCIGEAMRALPSIQPKPIECEDVISRQAAIDEIKSHYRVDNDLLEVIAYKISKLLSVQPKIKMGHWIEVEKYSDGKHKIKCSECRSHIIDRGHANSYVVKEKYKYCPRCGAKMIESQERSDKE